MCQPTAFNLAFGHQIPTAAPKKTHHGPQPHTLRLTDSLAQRAPCEGLWSPAEHELRLVRRGRSSVLSSVDLLGPSACGDLGPPAALVPGFHDLWELF